MNHFSTDKDISQYCGLLGNFHHHINCPQILLQTDVANSFWFNSWCIQWEPVGHEDLLTKGAVWGDRWHEQDLPHFWKKFHVKKTLATFFFFLPEIARCMIHDPKLGGKKEEYKKKQKPSNTLINCRYLIFFLYLWTYIYSLYIYTIHIYTILKFHMILKFSGCNKYCSTSCKNASQ